jgi:hypothetical protein
MIDGDNDVALSLFMAALDSFTSMDIHRDRADCMVRMAAIFEQRTEIGKTVNLLQRARSLYERSSQEKEIIKIDTKLRAMATAPKSHETRFRDWHSWMSLSEIWGELNLQSLMKMLNKTVTWVVRRRRNRGCLRELHSCDLRGILSIF